MKNKPLVPRGLVTIQWSYLIILLFNKPLQCSSASPMSAEPRHHPTFQLWTHWVTIFRPNFRNNKISRSFLSHCFNIPSSLPCQASHPQRTNSTNFYQNSMVWSRSYQQCFLAGPKMAHWPNILPAWSMTRIAHMKLSTWHGNKFSKALMMRRSCWLLDGMGESGQGSKEAASNQARWDCNSKTMQPI